MTPEEKAALEAEQKTKAIAKELAPIIDEQVEAKVKEATDEAETKMKEMEEELKNLSLSNKKMVAEKGVDEKTKQSIIVETFKSIAGQSQVTEAQFKEAFGAASKAAFNSEGTAGEGAELVFTQFSDDILTVMKQYNLVNELNIYTIKGNEFKIPKGVNNIATNWIAEWTAITKSKAGSAFVTINTYKAATLVPFTEELLQDNVTTPKYYDMVVKMIGESQGGFLEDQVLNGTDVNKVEGVLVNTNVGTAALPSGVVTLRGASAAQLDDLVVDVDTTIGAEYQVNPENEVIVMSKYVRNIYRKAKTTTGAYMFPEMRDANPTLHGTRVLVSHKAPMQNQAADVAGATAFVKGEFKTWFGVAMSEDLTLTRGYDDGDFAADRQSVKSRRRFGGKCLFGEAFGKGKTAAS